MTPLLARSECLPASLADTWGGHGVTVNPALAVRSDIYGAALHPVRIVSTTDFTHSAFLLASTAFLVSQFNN